MKFLKKLLLGTASFSVIVSVPALLVSCGAVSSNSSDQNNNSDNNGSESNSSNNSNEQYSNESADVEASVMVSNGTNDRTMSQVQISAQQKKALEAKAELETLQKYEKKEADDDSDPALKALIDKVNEHNAKKQSISDKSFDLQAKVDAVTGNEESDYINVWTEIAEAYKENNIGHLFVSKSQYLSTYKETHKSLIIDKNINQDVSNDNKIYSYFLSDYLHLASLKEEFLIYAYAKKMDSEFILGKGQEDVKNLYGYLTHNIRKEKESLQFLLDYAFAA